MDVISSIIADYRSAFPQGSISEHEAMSGHTTLKIGGRVRAMAKPASAEELAWLARECRARGVRSLILGNGSNMLFSDEDMELFVICTGGLCDISADGERITAGAGATLSRIAAAAQAASLTGFEFAHGIPGSLGGAVYMNAGAYGGEMKDVVESVTAIDSEGSTVEFGAGDCGFSYRGSAFCDNGCTVLSAVIKLRKGDGAEIAGKMADLAQRRREKQPLNLPSAGSTFKRPKEGYAAAMIDEAGLKGFSIGGAQVSEKHAGFVVNTGGATFDDFMGVIRHVQEEVLRRTGIMLEPEVRIIR